MKAILHKKYGSPDVLELGEIDKPVPKDDQVLVRVRAVSLNRADWYGLTGTPLVARPMTGLRAPKGHLFGADFAGIVEAVGPAVTDLEVGDEVFGGQHGSLAEYVATSVAAPKPANLTLEEAAAIPISGLTALQGLRDHGQLRSGEQVLVIGASGGVGTFAVQIAKAFGGEVTAVCSTANLEQARSLGADHVSDYTREDFTRDDRCYDLVLDVSGGKSWRALKRVLKPKARVVIVGGPMSRWLGPLAHLAGMKLGALRSSQTAPFFVCKFKREDLETLRELIEAGKVKPVVQQRFDLSELSEALGLLGEGHAQGKLVVAIP
jgi:NADPH:quinone reductase-like Zn-dependent oxidoreductase